MHADESNSICVHLRFCLSGVLFIYNLAMPDDLQSRCELGQQQLMRTEYLQAEATLASVEHDAWTARDFDTLSRVYMPLQEARRQRRQRCGEGVVSLDLLADGPADHIDGRRIVENYPQGQLLVAGWRSIAPAIHVRELQREHGLYVETFLGAVYPVGGGRAVVIAPLEDVKLPDLDPASIDELIGKLPAHCIVLSADELPAGVRRGDTTTYAQVMAMWERLHTPFLAAADMQVDRERRIEGYRKTQRVDYACELAHQKASDVARELARESRRRS
jgi:hypothetical protein